MSSIYLILLPLARLIGHSLASAIGFFGLMLTTVVPVKATQFLVVYGVIDDSRTAVFERVETCLLYIDIALFGGLVIMYSGLFMFEEYCAIKCIAEELENDVQKN